MGQYCYAFCTNELFQPEISYEVSKYGYNKLSPQTQFVLKDVIKDEENNTFLPEAVIFEIVDRNRVRDVISGKVYRCGIPRFSESSTLFFGVRELLTEEFVAEYIKSYNEERRIKHNMQFEMFYNAYMQGFKEYKYRLEKEKERKETEISRVRVSSNINIEGNQ